MGSSLIIRKRRDGTTTIQGDLPVDHVFSARWIERELGDLVDVTITVKADGVEQAYRLEGFEQIDDGEGGTKPNFTGWVATQVEG